MTKSQGDRASGSAEKLPQILRASAAELQSAFDKTAQIKHAGMRGATREERVSTFLRERLPRTVEVLGSGEVISVDGETSGQCDVLLVEPNYPPFFVSDSHKIVPSECVHGVLEVKSRLNKAEIIDACNKIAQVKSLPKTAYFSDYLLPRETTAYGKKYPYRPTAGFIFAYASRISIQAVAEHVFTWCESHPPDLWPNAVWVLEHGSVVWQNMQTKRIALSPNPETGLICIKADEPRDVLLSMVLQLHGIYVSAWTPPFNVSMYMGDVGIGQTFYPEPPGPPWPSDF